MPPPSKPLSNDKNAQLWRDVYETSLAGLRGFLRHRLKQEADVEDCLQAVYLKVIRLTTDVPLGARKAWLFRVAANEAALIWRRKSSTDRVLEKQASVIDDVAHDDSVSQLIRSETTQQVRQIIDTLPKTTQQIIRLRIDDDLTFQEIADKLQIPLGTALTRMRRALEKIKHELDTDN